MAVGSQVTCKHDKQAATCTVLPVEQPWVSRLLRKYSSRRTTGVGSQTTVGKADGESDSVCKLSSFGQCTWCSFILFYFIDLIPKEGLVLISEACFFFLSISFFFCEF